MAQADGKACVPVTMLSGFLGAGKTTLLRHLLQNADGLKIGCIINDVAGVNVDAKLVRNDRNREGEAVKADSTSDLTDTVELANGCACCSIQDELFTSFEQLIALSDKRGTPFDRIVLENSGVAEPHNIRELFSDAEEGGHPLLSRVRLDTLVTVVDAHTFGADYESRTPLMARPDLGADGTLRPVVDLLVEQIECADFVLLNKSDLLPADKLQHLVEIVTSLNPLATVLHCEHGKVDLKQVFGKESRAIVAHLNVEGQHRGAVAAVRAQQAEGAGSGAGGSHAGEHGGHEHVQEKGHDHDGAQAHRGEACKHEEGQHTDECGHSGVHSHAAHVHGPGCGHDVDAGHGHDAGHDKEHGKKSAKDRQQTSAATRYGIRSFVFSRRRPFHPQRLKSMVLAWLPVSKNEAIEGVQSEAGPSPIKAVLRSKGFMWMSSSHVTAFFWSHAGQHFEIRDEGDWWAAVPEADWPTAPAQRQIILQDYEFSTPWGDRRQEIVFIGTGMDEAAISAQLDGALLTDEEMERYAANYGTATENSAA